MKTSDFYFELPPELIAQTPLPRRDASRLMCVDKLSGAVLHRRFTDLAEILRPGDLLVMNDSRVLPARLIGTTAHGGAAEILLLTQKSDAVWECLVKPGKRLKSGAIVNFGTSELSAEIADVLPDGNRLVRFRYDGVFLEILEELGTMPLPPYIRERLTDSSRYQTVYAREPGSAAAPTAGLHFTSELLSALEARGVELRYITLHVGLGTFRPVKADNLLEHKMHSEFCVVPDETLEAVHRAKRESRRVIAVGTTACRALESGLIPPPLPPQTLPDTTARTAPENGRRVGISSATVGDTTAQTVLESGAVSGWVDIFIYPGYEFNTVDALITNFHLPESTLIMLVSALAGRENVLNAYRTAVEARYRFFSFGDAMFIS
jgi:S-adenosylmethionine:tRNA ribosyltransferase-isomerase